MLRISSKQLPMSPHPSAIAEGSHMAHTSPNPPTMSSKHPHAHMSSTPPNKPPRSPQQMLLSLQQSPQLPRQPSAIPSASDTTMQQLPPRQSRSGSNAPPTTLHTSPPTSTHGEQRAQGLQSPSPIESKQPPLHVSKTDPQDSPMLQPNKSRSPQHPQSLQLYKIRASGQS